MWCPKCKNEYRAGITKCADCGEALVESLSASVLETDKPESDIPDYSPENGENCVSPSIDDVKNIAQMIENGEIDVDELKQAVEAAKKKQTLAYVPKKNKYEDNLSSAWTFFIVGGIGTVAIILHLFGIIDFNLSSFSRTMINSVMGALFIGFLIIGIISYKNAAKYKKEAEAEEALTAKTIDEFKSEYTKESIDEKTGVTNIDNTCNNSDSSATYDIWQKRYNFIKCIIYSRISDESEAYIEYITEKIYNDYYAEENSFDEL